MSEKIVAGSIVEGKIVKVKPFGAIVALGENASDITIAKTGVIIAAQGCTSLEELNTKLEAGETVKGIVVTLFAGKALSAEYKVLSSEDTK